MLSNLQSALGILAFVGLAWVLSENRARFPTRIVLAGLALQFGLALALLKLPLFKGVFLAMNEALGALEHALRRAPASCSATWGAARRPSR
jgi:CNT family concentrative nucleoside transporter